MSNHKDLPTVVWLHAPPPEEGGGAWVTGEFHTQRQSPDDIRYIRYDRAPLFIRIIATVLAMLMLSGAALLAVACLVAGAKTLLFVINS